VDTADDQHPQPGGGNDTPRPDLQLKLFPSPEEQIQRIEEAEGTTATAETPSAFSMPGSFPQEAIDEALCMGSGFQYGKFRIYEQFGESLSNKENADFLKNEYGIGGSHPAYGIGVARDHDGKGMTITFGDENKNKTQTFLNWTQAAKRIKGTKNNFIRSILIIRKNRRLSGKSKSLLPLPDNSRLPKREIRCPCALRTL
jgi:hypothetical protein